ncbi:hypothetical protein [Paenibacillus sp. Marseille-Q4541]|uniref:hypothetical protein n=1 Tax=Paenibacillus sp. Marseille-Q4541 TaxID=2831522 RepID=UPI001BA82C50|nr:hypothetical protein [Paenibacillus sp. Marseille-Q4541]
MLYFNYRNLDCIVSIFSIDRSKKLYGNDEESIKKVITSIKGYENESIEILKIQDFYDVRMVGFLSNNNPAYIQFIKNHKGNYEWRHIEKSPNQPFASYLIQESNNEAESLYFMIVTNEANNIAKMQLRVNEQVVVQQEFNVNQKSVTWVALPKSKDETYAFKYKYYDKDGKIIK